MIDNLNLTECEINELNTYYKYVCVEIHNLMEKIEFQKDQDIGWVCLYCVKPGIDIDLIYSKITKLIRIYPDNLWKRGIFVSLIRDY